MRHQHGYERTEPDHTVEAHVSKDENDGTLHLAITLDVGHTTEKGERRIQLSMESLGVIYILSTVTGSHLVIE